MAVDLKFRKKVIAQAAVLILVIVIIWIIIRQPKDPLAGLVPDHASWYMEVDKPIEVLKGVQKGLRLFSDPKLTIFTDWLEELKFVQDLLSKDQKINQYIQKTSLGLSAHVITGKDAGYVFYIPVEGKDQKNIFDMLKKVYSNPSQYNYTEREYLGQKIIEIKFKKNGATFSVTGCDGALAGSFSGFLIEEVVRKSGLLFKPNFVSKLKKDARFTGISTKPVRLFLNLKNAENFIYQYLSKSMTGLQIPSSLGTCLSIGFDSPNGLDWNSYGFLLVEDPKEKGNHNAVLNASLANYIPENEVMGFQYSISDVWNSLQKSGSESANSRIDTLDKIFGKEVYFSLVEGDGLKKYNKILVTQLQNPALFDVWMEQMEKNIPDEKKYKEKLGDDWIKLCARSEIGKMIGGDVMDWLPLFYCKKGDFILFSDDLSALRKSIETAQKPRATETRNEKVNPSFLNFKINVQSSIPLLMESAQGTFKSNFDQWLPLLKSIKSISISDNGESESPSLNLHFRWKLPLQLTTNWEEKSKIFFDTSIVSGPTRLELTGSDKVYWAVQDAKFNTYLLDESLKKKVNTAQGSKWVSNPEILSEKGENSFSLFVPTKGALYVTETNGKNKFGFPLHLPDSNATINNVSAIDYDLSYQYRFFATSRYGLVFASDLSGKFLEGWNPWKHDRPFGLPPIHVRIGEKDLIVMLDEMGSLILTNRKGEVQAGFPKQLTSRTKQPIFVEKGLDLKTSFMYILSDLGLMEKINFEGLSSSNQQLFRPDKDTKFQFCIDHKRRTFAVARLSGKNVVVFDQSYRQIFQFEGKSEMLQVQHFHFGSSDKIFAINDLESKQCYLFDESGQPLVHPDLVTDGPIDVIRNQGEAGEYLLILPYKNKVSILKFRKI